jgi:hypothetical protein
MTKICSFFVIMEEGRNDALTWLRCLAKLGKWTKNYVTYQRDTRAGDNR